MDKKGIKLTTVNLQIFSFRTFSEKKFNGSIPRNPVVQVPTDILPKQLLSVFVRFQPGGIIWKLIWILGVKYM
jgi:hypothetical protein